MAALAPAKRIDRRALREFDAVLNSWRAEQAKTFYKGTGVTYDDDLGLDDPNLPIVVSVPDNAAPIVAPTTSKQKKTKPAAKKADTAPMDSDAAAGPTTTSGGSASDATATGAAGDSDSNRVKFVRSGGHAAGTSFSSADDNVPTLSNDDASTRPARLVSFFQACSADSSRLCSNPNPFATTVCMQLHKEKLSPLCSSYHAAKLFCYMEVQRLELCPDAARRFRCLDEHKFDPRLGDTCTKTKFMYYLRHRKQGLKRY